MSGIRRHYETASGAGPLIHDLHVLVVRGPRDLRIASALSQQGFDAVKWAEGQSKLAELLTPEGPLSLALEAAAAWYDEAAETARSALAGEPQLLEKLGLH